MGEYNIYNVCHDGEEMPIGYTTNTCEVCIHVSTCKVDYMMVNTFMYAARTLSYNKVMHITPESYRVVIIVEC